jgi:hypothetical protein
VLWAAEAAKIGYQSREGNGRRVKFWKDQWFGSSSWLFNIGRSIVWQMSKIALLLMSGMALALKLLLEGVLTINL